MLASRCGSAHCSIRSQMECSVSSVLALASVRLSKYATTCIERGTQHLCKQGTAQMICYHDLAFGHHLIIADVAHVFCRSCLGMERSNPIAGSWTSPTSGEARSR